MEEPAKKEAENKLGISLIKTVGVPEIKDLAAEIMDVVLDSSLHEGLLKDISVVGWLVKARGAYFSISDRLVLKKIARFLYGASEASAEERQSFQKRIDQDETFKERVGDNLILLIAHHDRLEKSELLGKFFAKIISGELKYDLFLRLATALQTSSVEDLDELRKNIDDLSLLSMDVQQGLFRSGLMNLHIDAQDLSEGGRFISSGYDITAGVQYYLSELGGEFLRFAFDVKGPTADSEDGVA